ncbi:MAG TPA: L,D-transpeptidase [Longimicrobiaceae bacterium]|jgi:murein L,D-transpeptidase YcbB/YkuD|nr:L,D-transpeptidase [Longimicrobiaceae bacterium]
MTLRRLAVLLAALVATPAAAQQPAPLHLDLNIPALRLVVYEGDAVVRSYPVAVGMPGHNTPTGDFSIKVAEWNPSWQPPERAWAKDEKRTPPGPNNPMGRVKLFFAPYYFVHGSPDDESIGSPESHGCVRMHNRDAIALARLLHSRAAPQVSSADIDRILSHYRDTRRVDFRTPIPIHIHYDPVVVADGTIHVYPDIYHYHAIHSEAVYQALIAAGYDVRLVKSADVNRLVDRARGSRTPIALSVQDAFGSAVAASEGSDRPRA